MKFIQIAVTHAGRNEDNSAYNVALFALNEAGEIYTLKTTYGDQNHGDWKKVEGPKE